LICLVVPRRVGWVCGIVPVVVSCIISGATLPELIGVVSHILVHVGIEALLTLLWLLTLSLRLATLSHHLSEGVITCTTAVLVISVVTHISIELIIDI
jgi:hypothetical protein